MQNIMKGMTLQAAQTFDHFFTIDVTLFYQVSGIDFFRPITNDDILPSNSNLF